MKNRNMFYQNTQTSYQQPGMFIPPNGYSMNTEYQSFGPNVMPNMVQNTNELEDRISQIEKQIRALDNRLQKLENATNSDNDNFYMI